MIEELSDEAMWVIASEYQKAILETGEVGELCRAIARKAEQEMLRQVVKLLDDALEDSLYYDHRIDRVWEIREELEAEMKDE